MRPLTVMIERTDNNYSAYLKEVDGVVATGKTVNDIKKGIVNSIQTLIEDCKEFGGEIPDELQGDLKIVSAKAENTALRKDLTTHRIKFDVPVVFPSGLGRQQRKE